MTQLLAYKYRIYPTEEQQVLLGKTFGCKRVIFNYYLNEQQTRYAAKEKRLSNYDINKDITTLKESKEWLREVDSIALHAVRASTNLKNLISTPEVGLVRIAVPIMIEM